MYRMGRYMLLAAMLAAALANGACSRSLSRGIDENGVPDEVRWPDLRDKHVMQEATTPNQENLAKLRVGMNKQDIYNLLGAPHFREMFGAREWDYMFRYQQGNETQICQFKIIFDDDKLAGTFHWNPEGCGRHFGITQPLPAAKRQ